MKLQNLFCPLVFVLVATASTTVSAQKPEELFTKSTVSESTSHFVDSGKFEEVFTFTDDGFLRCEGKPFGYIASKKSYKNFKMSVEYLWPADVKPTNSGVFLRINAQPNESFLPRGFEVQLAHKSAGDLWAFHGMKIAGPKNRLVENPNSDFGGRVSGAKRLEEAEKEPGHWNTLDILCADSLVVVCLNGKIVNWTNDAETTPGKVGLQSEGGPILFRNCTITELP